MAKSKASRGPKVRGTKTWTGKVYRCESWEALGLCPESTTKRMPTWIGNWKGTLVTVTQVLPGRVAEIIPKSKKSKRAKGTR